jgi:soluble lytic murein transglycosylase-like protein
MKLYIILLIYAHAPTFNIDPNLAMAVAHTESSFRPNVIGPVGEVGIFQVRPEFSEYTAEELFIPEINVLEGLRILSNAKQRCPHKDKKMFVICFNTGVRGSYKIQNPHEFRYYQKVYSKYQELKVPDVP